MAGTQMEDYRNSLKELTLNSRPIIDNLTTIARENPQIADGIIAVIVERIRTTRPEYKLYALYLLDSICKTIGNPYNILVGEEIFDLFSHIFQLGNEQTRTSLIKVFETWKVTKTRGTSESLFPVEQMQKISNFLSKAGYPKKNGGVDEKKLIENINSLVVIFQKKANANANDTKSRDRLAALSKLKQLLSSKQLKPQELAAIQSQLTNMRDQEARSTPPPTVPTKPSVTTAQTVVATPMQPQTNIQKANELFQALINSGIVKLDQAPIPGSKPNYDLVFPKVKYQPPSAASSLLDEISQFHKNIQRSEFEKLKFQELMLVSKQRVQDFQFFINNNKPEASQINLLYEAKLSKCGLCGKRFTTDVEGSDKKRLHLDWHFRINKKLASGSNVQSRNWYLDDYEWVNFKEEELLEFATMDEKKMATKEATTTSTTTKIPFVVVPPNDNNMNNRCVICRENVKATYNEDSGEWCWLNCVRPAGEGNESRKIMHVTCFNEANRKRSADDNLAGAEKRMK